MAVDFKDLTMSHLMAALPHLVTEGISGRFVYNIHFENTDETRVPNADYWVAIEDGQVSYGEGVSDDPEATGFTVNMGGLDTIIAFQAFGLQAATSAMILGYIYTTNIKKAEMWFKLLKVGKAEMVEALVKAGIEVGSTDLDIYAELMVG